MWPPPLPSTPFLQPHWPCEHSSHAPALGPSAGSLRVLVSKALVLVLALALKDLDPGKPHSAGQTEATDHFTFFWNILLQDANQANPFTPIRPLRKSCFLSETLRFPPSALQPPYLASLCYSIYYLLAYYVLYMLIFIICGSSVATRIPHHEGRLAQM